MDDLERKALAHFRDNFVSNPKKLKKLAARMLPDYPDHIKRGLLYDVMTQKDPIAYLERCFRLERDAVEIVQHLIESGYHGMILNHDDTIPVQLKAPEHWMCKDDEWNPADELDIQHKAVEDWFNSSGLKRAEVKIVMFKHFGFSGIPREIHKSKTKNPW